MVELDDVRLHADPLEERLHLHAISAHVEHINQIIMEALLG
jgi:hypothetical protein